MKSMILFFKCILIGIGKIIPGVSGAVLAVILNVYDEGIDRITNFFRDIKENTKFLLICGSGVVTGIVLFSNVIKFMLDKYYFNTMFLFIGLIIGGIWEIRKEVLNKDIKYTIITIILFSIISLFNINNSYILRDNFVDYIILFIAGIIEVCGTVIPGISSTVLLLLLGVYNYIIDAISDIVRLNINYDIFIPFGIGIISSIYFITKLINYCINKKRSITYSVILGLIISSVIVLIVKVLSNYVSMLNLSLGIIFMIVGIFSVNILRK